MRPPSTFEGLSGDPEKSTLSRVTLCGKAANPLARHVRLACVGKSQGSRYRDEVISVRILRHDVLVEVRRRIAAPRSRTAQRGAGGVVTHDILNAMTLRAVNTETVWASMMMLTYPDVWPKCGRIVKGDLNRILTLLRGKWPGMRYLWFLEFQEREAPHLHFLCSLALPHPRETLYPKHGKPYQIFRPWETWLREAWRSSIRLGGTHCTGSLIVGWQAIRDPDGGARYACKYARKQEQKMLPEEFRNVGRWWGCDYVTSRLTQHRAALTSDELRSLLGDSALNKFGLWHQVQHGAADRLRAYVAGRDAPSLPLMPAETAEGESGCQCPICRSSRRAWREGRA